MLVLGGSCPYIQFKYFVLHAFFINFDFKNIVVLG